jgi:hypothetical protein
MGPGVTGTLGQKAMNNLIRDPRHDGIGLMGSLSLPLCVWLSGWLALRLGPPDSIQQQEQPFGGGGRWRVAVAMSFQSRRCCQSRR